MNSCQSYWGIGEQDVRAEKGQEVQTSSLVVSFDEIEMLDGMVPMPRPRETNIAGAGRCQESNFAKPIPIKAYERNTRNAIDKCTSHSKCYLVQSTDQ